MKYPNVDINQPSTYDTTGEVTMSYWDIYLSKFGGKDHISVEVVKHASCITSIKTTHLYVSE